MQFLCPCSESQERRYEFWNVLVNLSLTSCLLPGMRTKHMWFILWHVLQSFNFGPRTGKQQHLLLHLEPAAPSYVPVFSPTPPSSSHADQRGRELGCGPAGPILRKAAAVHHLCPGSFRPVLQDAERYAAGEALLGPALPPPPSSSPTFARQ